MIGLFALLVFAVAGCASVAVIGVSVHAAVPQVRRLLIEQRELAGRGGAFAARGSVANRLSADGSLATDRAFLFSVIEMPRHEHRAAPVMVSADAVVANPAVANPAVAAPRARIVSVRLQVRSGALRVAA